MKNYLSAFLCFISLPLIVEAWQPNDPLFYFQEEHGHTGFTYVGQWYLANNAPNPVYDDTNARLDINVTPLWDRNITGKGVVIGVIDDFIQGDHPDLAPNYREDLSKFFYENVAMNDIKKNSTIHYDYPYNYAHGTMVAGLAAARGGNGIGITGAAPHVGLTGLSSDFGEKIIDATWHESGIDKTTGEYASEPSIHIKNHSYITTEDLTKAIQLTSENNVIHVIAAGNNRQDTHCKHRNSNLLKNQSLPYPIVVSAINAAGNYTNYSNYGANVFVVAPGGEGGDFTISSKVTNQLFGIFRMPTTDLSWASSGYNKGKAEVVYRLGPLELSRHDLSSQDYTSYFSGTSAAAPLVSGTLALVKEVNPLLDHRMAKHCLVKSSRIVDRDDGSYMGGWVKNAADIYFNNNYGFGLIDATAIADTAEETAYVTADRELIALNIQTSCNCNKTVITQTFEFIDSIDLPVEQLSFGADLFFQDRKTWDGLQIDLISPQGTCSKILTPLPYCLAKSSIDIFYDSLSKRDKCFAYKGHSFTTNAFWGENSHGKWTLSLQDLSNGLEGFSIEDFQATLFIGKRIPQLQGLQFLEEDTNANALTLLKHNNNWFVIEKGKTLRLKDGVLIRKGTLTINGAVEETDYKGNRIDMEGGELNGEGIIYARRGFYNTEGKLNSQGLKIIGNYKQGPYGTLLIELSAEGKSMLCITGDADLQGTAQVQIMDGYELVAGSQLDVLQANSLQESITSLNFDSNQGELFTFFAKNDTLKVGVICDKSHCINPNMLSIAEDSDFLSAIEKTKRSSASSIPIYLHLGTKAIIPELSVVLENQIHAINQNISLPTLKDEGVQFLGMADEHTQLILSLNGLILYKGCSTIDTIKTFNIAGHTIELTTTYSEPDRFFTHKAINIKIQPKQPTKESVLSNERYISSNVSCTPFITSSRYIGAVK